MSKVWLSHVAQGEAFSAENFVIPSAGLAAHIQLLNPAGSGKRVRLRSAHATGSVAVSASLRRHDTPLATLGLPAGFIVENMLSNGPASVAEMRSVASAAVFGALFWQVNAPGASPATYPPEGREWGFDLLPGQGILFRGVVASVLIINWQWVEVDL